MISRRQLIKISALGTASFAAPAAYPVSEITMSYNTRNPIGSTDPRDLSDNAKSIDNFANGPASRYTDRFSVDRKSIPGMIAEFDSDQTQRNSEFQSAQGDRESTFITFRSESKSAFEAAQASRASQFEHFLQSSGYALLGDYADSPLQITAHNQYFMKGGRPYRLSSFVAVPYSTTGDWTTESDAFVLLGDDVLRQEMAGPGGAALSNYQNPVYGSIKSDLYKRALEEVSAVNDFGADPSGLANSTAALLAFYTHCLSTGHPGVITAGTYLVTPGQLDFSSGWIDRPFPHIKTAGHGSVFFVAASDVNAPMLRINNGTSTSALYRLWRGGSHGGVTFVDPFPASTATARHGLSIYGFSGTHFGYIRGQGLRGDLLHFERKLYAGNNPDPHNVSFCEFDGVESNASLGYGMNNDNSVGVTHCKFKFTRIIDGISGGIRGVGVASEYAHISMGNQRGWAIDIPFDLLNGGRTAIKFVELDNCEKGYNIEALNILTIEESRIVHRCQLWPNTSAVYWPTISYNVSPLAKNVINLTINGIHRIDAGGSLSVIGKFVECNNSANIAGMTVNLDIVDGAGLGILDSQIAAGLSRSAPDVQVFRRGKKIASTSSIVGCALTATTSQQVANSGYPGVGAKINFPTKSYDHGGNYNPATGCFTVPYEAIYRFRACITLAVPVGTRVRLGIGRTSSSLIASRVYYADTANARTYTLEGASLIHAGEEIYVQADQNSAAAVNLVGVDAVSVENAWSIEAMQ